MGDYASPKRRDVYDRLRRRFEQYRRRHIGVAGRYEQLSPTLCDQERQQTLLLQQRWLESKAKKVSKSSKSNVNNAGGNLLSGGNQGDRANNNPPLNKKRKADQDLGGSQPSNIDQVYNFEDTEEKHQQGGNNNKGDSRDKSCLHTSRCDVSVNIIQEGNCTGNQTSKIHLTVSSTLHAPNNNDKNSGAPNCQSNVSQTSTIETNICKKEPQDKNTDSNQQGTQNLNNSTNSSQASFPDNFLSIGEVDEELRRFLDTLSPGAIEDLMDPGSLGQDTSDGNNDLMPELAKFPDQQPAQGQTPRQQQQQVSLPNNNLGDNKKCSGVRCDKKDNSHPSTPGVMYGDPQHSVGSPNNQNFAPMGGPGTMPMPVYPRPQSRPPGPGTSPGVGPAVPPLLGDTGPAAETLKRMAVQHQAEFMKGGPMPPMNDNMMDSFRRTGQYQYYGQQGNMPYYAPQIQNGTPNSMQPDRNGMAQGFPGQTIPKIEPGMGDYGATKRLSHYPEPVSSAPSSSLQQLQNQVRSQFSQADGGQSGGQPSFSGDGTQFQLKQQMQMTASTGGTSVGGPAPSQSIQISQTQQMQINTGPGGPSPQHISMSQQQQSFSMSQGGPANMQPSGGPGPGKGPYMRQPSEGYPQPPGGDKMAGNQAPVRQYMDHAPPHPPPEYKPPTGGNYVPGPGSGMPAGMRDSSNPLQTMQNMVNQTPQSLPSTPTGNPQEMMYHQHMVKSEMVPGMNGQMIPHQGIPQMGPGPRQTSPAGPGGPNGSMISPRPTPPYPMGHPQQQAMPGQSMANGTGPKSGKPGTPMYTSAIMRGQRPPNVNVGPDGLNISHQRNPSEWPPRHMMGPGHHPAMGMSGPPNYPGGIRPGMTPQGMMQYPAGYPGGYSGGMNMGRGGGMDPQQQMQMSQQQAMAIAHHQRMSQSYQQQHQMMSMPGGMAGPGMAHPQSHQPQMPHGPSHMAPGMHMSQHQQMSMHHNGQAMAMNQSAVSSQMHNIPPQPHPHSAAQGQGYPGPPTSQPPNSGPQRPPNSRSNPSGPEFALDFLDNPSSGNSDFFDSMVQNTNPSDFNNFIDDILGSGK